jgi:hypothetical protein
MVLCDCVNCSRWRDNKSNFVRGTKGKEQWQASQRWYQCFQVKKHQEADYHARNHVEGTSNIAEDYNEGSANEGSCPSPRPRSAKLRMAESNTPPDSDHDDAEFVDLDLDSDCDCLDGPPKLTRRKHYYPVPPGVTCSTPSPRPPVPHQPTPCSAAYSTPAPCTPAPRQRTHSSPQVF